MRLKDLSRLVPSEEHGDTPAIFYWLHIVVATITAALLVLAVTDMLVGVLLLEKLVGLRRALAA